jgi:hypothetical protein
MAANMPEFLEGLPNIATTPPSATHVQKLLGMKEAHYGIPSDFACWVLTNMPPSAALRGLGLMDDRTAELNDRSSRRRAELNGYIKCRDEMHKEEGLEPEASCIKINTGVMNFIDDRNWCPGWVSPCWKACAVGALVRTVQGGVNLADLRSDKGEDRRYLALMDIEPNWRDKVQPLPSGLLPQDGVNYFTDAEWDFAAGCQPPVGPLQQAQSPFRDAGVGGYQPPAGHQQQQGAYMAGGISLFDLSHLPEPNPAGSPYLGNPQAAQAPAPGAQQAVPYSPGTESLYLATPRVGTPFGSPLPQQSPFSQQNMFPQQGSFSTSDSTYGSVPNTPRSLVGPFLTPHFQAHVITRSRTASPLASGMSSLRMSPAPGYGQSPSPTPSLASQAVRSASPSPSAGPLHTLPDLREHAATTTWLSHVTDKQSFPHDGGCIRCRRSTRSTVRNPQHAITNSVLGSWFYNPYPRH